MTQSDSLSGGRSRQRRVLASRSFFRRCLRSAGWWRRQAHRRKRRSPQARERTGPQRLERAASREYSGPHLALEGIRGDRFRGPPAGAPASQIRPPVRGQVQRAHIFAVLRGRNNRRNLFEDRHYVKQIHRDRRRRWIGEHHPITAHAWLEGIVDRRKCRALQDGPAQLRKPDRHRTNAAASPVRFAK